MNSWSADFVAILQEALAGEPECDADRRLSEFLAGHGFDYPSRTATNIRLLAETLPLDCLSRVTVAALATPVPDMALNNLERVSSMVGRDDLLAVCQKKSQLSRLLTILGSSPF